MIALDIIRKQYLNEVDSVLGVPVIKVITGMRRVGKSTLLKQIQEMLIEKGVSPQHIISINFEWLEFEEQKDAIVTTPTKADKQETKELSIDELSNLYRIKY